jgi:pimeloyl-ACP methyl ester carboxylesterase
VDDRFLSDARIGVPTLLLADDFDWSTPVENAERLAGFLNAGHLVPIRGGRHRTETNYDELPAQHRDGLAQLYGFFHADRAGAFFRTLPGEL